MTSATSAEPPRAAGLIDLGCRKCRLCAHRTQVVPAEGTVGARLFLVGEAPGPDEDAVGRPFVGRAGKILRRCLQAAHVPSADAWISNVVKCFPHDRAGQKRRIRKPKPDEAAACRAWLAKEVAAVRPRLLVALGATAAEQLTGVRGLKLADARRDPLAAREELGGLPVFATYHPGGLRYGHATEADLVADLRAAYARALGG